MIITRTPFRISFFGGGTDFPAWYQEHGGAVLSTTINKYCYISCRHLPPFFSHKHRIVYSIVENVSTVDEIRHPVVRAVLRLRRVEEGVEIHHDGDLPARSGLGSSSSFTVGLLNALHALQGTMASKQALADDAIHVEQHLLAENVGCQDQIASAFGGLNRVDFHRDRSFSVTPIVCPPSRLEMLRAHLMLFFTGATRISSDVIARQARNTARNTAVLMQMKAQVQTAVEVLCDSLIDIREFGSMLHEGWQLKKSLSDGVSTSLIDEAYTAARRAGALGGKVLGAGGGGFMLFFVPPEAHGAVRDALGRLVHVPFGFDHDGSRIIYYNPRGH